MLRIRLQRMGRKKAPSYRLIVSERSKDPYAGGIEILGHYNPMAQPKILELKEDSIKEWIAKGAQPSNTVHNLLVKAGVISQKKQKSVKISQKRQKKIDAVHAEKVAKQKEAEEKAQAAEEARKAEAAEKAAAEAAASTEATSEEVVSEVETTDETPVEEAVSDAEVQAETEVSEVSEEEKVA
jgi:small subunit ribosomal protein S16